MVTNIASDFVMKAAKDWISECQHNHTACPPPETPLLPKRTVDLGPEYDGISVKLHIRKKDERAQYAALSYCWGGPQHQATKKSTIEAAISTISLGELPQTIRDAIHVTNKLGIRYL